MGYLHRNSCRVSKTNNDYCRSMEINMRNPTFLNAKRCAIKTERFLHHFLIVEISIKLSLRRIEGFVQFIISYVKYLDNTSGHIDSL